MRLERRDDHWRLVGGPVPRGAAAITLGPVVCVRRRAAGDEHLARHEAVHVQQWRRYGAVGFLARYLGAYAGLRLRGWPHWAAYRRIPLEVEAEWVARRDPARSLGVRFPGVEPTSAEGTVPEEAPAPPEVAPTWGDRLDLIAGPQPLTPQQLALGAVGLLAVLVAAWFLLREPVAPPAETVLPMAGATPGSTTTTSAPEVLVHAAGAVRTPGVYRLRPGARVTDLLDAAGGVAVGADLHRLNLAAPVTDGSQVYVPAVGEVPPAAPAGGAGGGGTDSAPDGPLDLNTATLEDLEELPGVGPATAQAILDEREKRGRFESVEDLLDVRGIGPAKLDGMRDLVTV